MRRIILSLCLSGSACLHATTITWTGQGPITSDSDISLAGTFAQAVSYGSGAGTINVTVGGETITFEGETAFAGGVVSTVNSSVTVSGRTAQTGFFDPTGTSVSADFESVLDSFAYDGPNPNST